MPLTSFTTPVPDCNPLDGGILMEGPYPTEAYNTPLTSQRRFLAASYRASLPNLEPLETEQVMGAFLPAFDTGKVAARGTLQRRKVRGRPELELESCLGAEEWDSGDPGGEDSPDSKCKVSLSPSTWSLSPFPPLAEPSQLTQLLFS